MAGFTFKFESILKLKEQIEKNIKNELALLIELLSNEKRKLDEVVRKQEDIIQEMKRESEKITIWRLKEYSGFIESLKDKINIQKNIVNQFQENVDITKGRLIEAMKVRKVYEKLKEIKLEEYVIQERKKEIMQIDEIISYKQNKRENDDGG